MNDPSGLDGLEKFGRECREQFPALQCVALVGPKADRLMYVVEVTVPFFEARQLTILVDPHNMDRRPQVFVADPRPMKHSFDSGSLCMWYEFDPPGSRWVADDGLLALVDLAAAHLYREERYRETGRWMGEEAPHGLPRHPGYKRRGGKQ